MDYTNEQRAARRKARNEYNKMHYAQPPVSIDIDLLKRFASCVKKRNELESTLKYSQAGILRNAMKEFVEETYKILCDKS